MKYVLFTGATGGLGELCVQALSEKKIWTVFAAGTNAMKLEELALLPRVKALQMDVTNDADVQRAYESVLTQTGQLDAIVNFAGTAAFCSMVEGECIDTAQKLLEINVMGTIRVNRIFFPLLEKGRGRIVNCSSEAGWMTPQPFAAPYYLSKYAVEAYNDSLRRELMFLGIPVVKIQPGPYKTQITKRIYDTFANTLAGTSRYSSVLRRMRPLMDLELGSRNNPAKLVKVVTRALESKHPRIQYRVGTGKMLALLQLFPEKVIDRIYLLVCRFRKDPAKTV